MKIQILSFCLIAASLLSCEGGEPRAGAQSQVDTTPPVITLLGGKTDTTYLQVSSTTLIANGTASYTWLPGNSASYYADRGAIVVDEITGQCTDLPVEVTGVVNNRLPGTYYLSYNASDAAGNKAATVTRTVYVVTDNSPLLNGSYNVACSCTAVIAGSQKHIVTKGNYTTTVAYSNKGCFNIEALNIGPERIIPLTYLRGNVIDVSFFSADFAQSSATGTLSPADNTFTIESTFYPYSPAVVYSCKNVFTKQALVN